MLKNLLSKKVIAAVVAAVIVIAAALNADSVVKYACMAEGFLVKPEAQSEACKTPEG